MDEQIGALQQQLAALNTELKEGAVFQSLGPRLGQLMDGIHRRRRTPVTLPDDQDGIIPLLTRLRGELDRNQPLELPLRDLDLLVHHLASPDPQIRYNGVNFTIYDALQQSALGVNDLVTLVNFLSRDESLFSHILEPTNAAVFGRASSASMLAVALHFVAENEAQGMLDYQHLVNQVATYICLETDTRGFVNQQGWAHAYAAIIDLLTVLSETDSLPRADKLFLLLTLVERLKRLTTPLIYGENDRMATYFVALTNRHALYETALLNALKQWRQAVARRRRPDNLAGWNQFFNRKRLADALRLRKDASPQIKKYLNSTIDFLG
ncbi:DUF2785 domain-containing protein [Levilactobacillus hammesii]|uniref:DUF2785 domain-containing protein n=1 Tax=Levilactobacillus hammesii DSM 16381 TaxID=1423753 RepID=A0A0R1UXJ4_9LACO|nr:DUF2785 domain-containing protein [Levilactobacillus hammesii]KRL95525.1 hypothetical protein FD28_GL002494 [Levilactobacillus hammesii DSM 16381]